MDNSLISVIVPVYSTEEFTGKCIESIINQTYRNLEIILVDDGSVDNCPAICDLYATKDDRIKVIHKENAGLVEARKTGLNESNGDMICYVDGDDWIGREFVSSLYAGYKDSQADIVVAGWTRMLYDKTVQMQNNTTLGIYSAQDLADLSGRMISEEPFFSSGISTFLWNKMFKRDVLYKCQMDVDARIMIGEDASVVYPAILKSNSINVIDNTDYHYRQHGGSMLKANVDKKAQTEKLRVLYEYLCSITDDEKWRSQVNDYVLASFIIRFGATNIEGIYEAFDNRYYGKNIVLYSAGTFGQKIVSAIIRDRRCNIAGWIDDDYWEYRRCCLNVDPVESIIDKEYDYILLASVDGRVSREIRNRLLGLGVPEEKILTMNGIVNKTELLDHYFSISEELE